MISKTNERKKKTLSSIKSLCRLDVFFLTFLHLVAIEEEVILEKKQIKENTKKMTPNHQTQFNSIYQFFFYKSYFFFPWERILFRTWYSFKWDLRRSTTACAFNNASHCSRALLGPEYSSISHYSVVKALSMFCVSANSIVSNSFSGHNLGGWIFQGLFNIVGSHAVTLCQKQKECPTADADYSV